MAVLSRKHQPIHRQVSAICYTLRYAAPEVIKAKRSGERKMVLEESLDAWSLGVMAFEMCTGVPAFPRIMGTEAVRSFRSSSSVVFCYKLQDKMKSKNPNSKLATKL
jgi:serine/threonine protein kinase